jgi:hypothetical protein
MCDFQSLGKFEEEILTVVFWVMTVSRLADGQQCFEEIYYLHIQGISKTSWDVGRLYKKGGQWE